MISLIRPNRHLCRHGGFTLIELVIVVVLIGVIAALAGPLFMRVVPRIKTRAEARAMLGAVRAARSRAIAENAQFGVYFDINGRNYILFKDKVNLSGRTYENGDSIVTGPVALEKDVVYTGTSFTNGTIVMLPTGAASQTGTVGVNSSHSDSPLTISVLAATGKTKLQ